MMMRYVDDTFVFIHEYEIDRFTKHINSQDPNIKFTIEPENEGRIPFLDTEVILNDDASTKTRVYRKPTHTDQYLNWSSNHHLEHKTSVVRTLLQRADVVSTTEEDREAEVKHIRTALAANGYQPWIMKIPNKKKKEKTPEKSTRAEAPPIALPYIQGLSENLQRIFKNHNITTYMTAYKGHDCI